MSILKMSILFSRAGTVANQLRVLVFSADSESDREYFTELLRDMDEIYSSENTRANRLELHTFIKDNALRIADGYSNIFRVQDDGTEYYSLKEER